MHASPPLGKRAWTAEEENYLRESWGTVTVDGICRHLNRTKSAIMVRGKPAGATALPGERRVHHPAPIVPRARIWRHVG